MQTFEFKVMGMDCADCASHVQKGLTTLPNVEGARVLLGAEKAVISYEDQAPDLEAIEQIVAAAGYRAVFDAEPIHTDNDNPQAVKTFSITYFISIIILILAATIIGERLGVFQILQQFVPWYVWAILVTAGGWPIFRNVLQSLAKRRIISHTLMSASVITAVLVGEWATALLIVAFMRLGDLTERKTTESARESVRELRKIAPKSARILIDGAEKEVDIGSIKAGDMVVIRPGESIPVDGMVREGNASVDQSAISGESMPAAAYINKEVYAASIVTNGMLIVEATAVGKDSTFGRIIQMVEEAEANRGEFQQMADKFSGYYLPIVALVALGTYILKRDPIAAASVMVVACSCSFSLATPVAMLASIGRAARKGLLFKGGKFVESLSKADTVFIDKTGTLTIGKPTITDIIPLDNYSEETILQLCASAEKYSEHPLAEAVLDAANEKGIDLLPVMDFKNIPGVGISADIEGETVSIVNNPKKETALSREKASQLQRDGKTLLFVHINDKTTGILAAEDVLREDAHQSIQELKDMGINEIKLISGDNQYAVEKIAKALGIAHQGAMKPTDKINAIKTSQRAGNHVVMIGDGINDAPALAQADVGISMGKTGTQIAVETSHIALLREDWSLIPEAFATAKRTMRVVRMNLLFTAVYNMIGLSLAAAGILPPAVSAAMQSIPDIGIMANSARLLRQPQQ